MPTFMIPGLLADPSSDESDRTAQAPEDLQTIRDDFLFDGDDQPTNAPAGSSNASIQPLLSTSPAPLLASTPPIVLTISNVSPGPITLLPNTISPIVPTIPHSSMRLSDASPPVTPTTSNAYVGGSIPDPNPEDIMDVSLLAHQRGIDEDEEDEVRTKHNFSSNVHLKQVIASIDKCCFEEVDFSRSLREDLYAREETINDL